MVVYLDDGKTSLEVEEQFFLKIFQSHFGVRRLNVWSCRQVYVVILAVFRSSVLRQNTNAKKYFYIHL